MGVPYSTAGGMKGSETTDVGVGTDLEMEGNPQASDRSRLVELMQAIQRIARLQKEAASAQIDARQKMREVGFKRQTVWVCDAAFMREIQRLMVEAPAEKFTELRKLGAECQAARDGLGPLEQEGIEAEQRWEGQIWKLRQTEEGLYDKFKDEFDSADTYPPPSMSVPSSRYGSYSDTESNHSHNVDDAEDIPPLRTFGSVISSSSLNLERSGEDNIPAELETNTSQALLGLTYTSSNEDYPSEWDSDSGFGDIDLSPDSWSVNDLAGPPQNLPVQHDAITERYPELSTYFGTRRERINKWLLHMLLLSHFEADLLVAQFDFENEKRPSNWSQLVIAYWELDVAAIPHDKQLSPLRDAGSPPKQPYQSQLTKQGSVKPSSSPTETATLASKPFASKVSGCSSNADLGYFSDFTSKSRDSLHSMAMAIQPRPLPSGFHRHSDLGQRAGFDESDEKDPH